MTAIELIATLNAQGISLAVDDGKLQVSAPKGALTDELREISGRANVPILIDQEGGRVSRMKPPVWPEFPAWAKFDALYDTAVQVVLKDRKCSTSYIQRKLAIGYNKAARLVEQMEEQGLVSPANHVGKREILVPEQG